MSKIASPPRASAAISPARQLQHQFAAARISFVWLGVRRALTSDQKSHAAQGFGADGEFMSAGKKIWNTRDPRIQALTGLRHRIVSYWRAMSLPYPENGLRLIRRDDIASFDLKMGSFREELAEAVRELDAHLDELKSDARECLGSLFDPRDYPDQVRDLFAVQWDYPNVTPPEYLRQLNPELYQEECRRVAARFDQAVELAEQAFFAEFSGLVAHLVERLQGSDGQKQVFKESTVENVKSFFGRFRELSIGSCPQLDALVQQAQDAIGGIAAQDLRSHEALRQQVAAQMAAVASQLDTLMVDAPRRKILRSAVPQRQAVA